MRLLMGSSSNLDWLLLEWRDSCWSCFVSDQADYNVEVIILLVNRNKTKPNKTKQNQTKTFGTDIWTKTIRSLEHLHSVYKWMTVYDGAEYQRQKSTKSYHQVLNNDSFTMYNQP